MKNRIFAFALCLALLVLSVCPALADVFNPIWVNGNLRLDVYSAPSTSSWRGANGKAMCNTDGEVRAAGRIGGWVLIAYYLSGGSNAGGYRVGYVQYSELKGLVSDIPQLMFQNRSAVITRDCTLTDDPFALETPITYLSSGTRVTYLMGFQNDYGNKFGYVETTYQGKTVRGFVRYDALEVS
ncbi:MAG: hypothetical protein IJ174_06880 [Clostridia bacterium]|nr:hypothetical protein [Clostridia bacterium]